MKIPLNKATPGMVLVEDVIRSGSVLLGASAILTVDIINILNKHGVQEIEITQPTTKDSSTHAIPRVTVFVTPDELRADIQVKPTGKTHEQLTLEDLHNTLKEKNVCYGVHHDKLQILVDKFNHSPDEISIHGVATGSLPSGQSDCHIEIPVRHITKEPHLEKARHCTAAWELKEAGIDFQRVKAGQPIAAMKSRQTDSDGMTVTGRKIPREKDDSQKSVHLEGNTVRFVAEKNVWESLTDGVTYFVQNRLGVLPISFDGDVEIIVTPDRLEAVMRIHPACEGGDPPSEKQIHRRLTELEITAGIDEEKLRDLCNALARGAYPQQPIVIAEGKAPVHGKNGGITFLFDTETSLKPRENPDGTVDYKNVNLIHSVSAGDQLVRLTPPEKGQAGHDIFGTELAAKDGVPTKLPAGINTVISDDNQELLVASVDGNVKYNGSVVEVSEGFVVEADVDFSTGNVSYAKSVIVGGDVKAGFSVECGGDLQVSGTIEDAHIKTGGHVLCRYGFVGQGKGLIESHGDVNLSFLKNQTIRSRNRITIAREAINGIIYARKSIKVGGNPLSVAGGLLMARDFISIRSVGNATGIKTTLEVGTDFILIEELQRTQEKIDELEGSLSKLEPTIQQFAKNSRGKKLTVNEEQMFKKFRTAILNYKKEISSLEKRKELIQRKVYNFTDAYIRIEHSAMPGTIIKIGERQHIVREEVIGPKTARLMKHEIKIG